MNRTPRSNLSAILTGMIIAVSTMAAAQDIDIWNAAATGDSAAVKQHIAAGTNLNGKEESSGSTPLMLAAVYGQTESGTLLIAGGAKMDLVNKQGNTALLLAAFFGHIDLVAQLLKKGASVNISNQNAETPLDTVAAPWDPSLADNYTHFGKSLNMPVDLKHLQAARPKIAELIRKYGGRSGADSQIVEIKPPPIEAADWCTYNHNFSGSRHNPAEKRLSPDTVPKLMLKWRFPRKGSSETVGMISATPSVVNGYVYFGTGTYPKFYKLSPDGQVVWSYTLRGGGRPNWENKKGNTLLVPKSGVYSSALVTDDAVYFSDSYGIAYCLNRQTGKEIWTVNTKAAGFPGAHPANLMMASPILAGELVVFGGGAYEHALPTDPNYECCYGRGFVTAFAPKTGRVVWKYDVGPEPEKFDPPIVIKSAWGDRTFHYGPSTSSVWSTPSYDAETKTVFFGTDTHNSPRKATRRDARNYTSHSAAVIAVDARTGAEKWVTQISKNQVWNHSMPSYNLKTGYQDLAIGDTPKIYSIMIDGKPNRVVGAGSKNGGFYVMRMDTGAMVAHTPIYSGPPSDTPKIDPLTLALPSPIGGLQTGCATDGKAIFTNGIDAIFKGTHTRKAGAPPTAGRVTSISLDTRQENWRHERPKVPWVGGTKEKPLFTNTGDAVASGIALANGCLFFTTFTSNKLVALNATTGDVLKEIAIGPVLAGPSVSRGRVYIGTGNTHFNESKSEAYFPKRATGVLYSFGTPGEDEIDRMGEGKETVIAKAASPAEAKVQKYSIAAAKARKYPPLPASVTRKPVIIWSDGTRMAGDLYSPKKLKPGDKLPTVVFIAGTGGVKKGSPARMAPHFVNADYIFLAFDYRGWGESDSKLLMLEPMPEPDENGEVTVKARAIRWQMDFADQTLDIRNAIAFVAGAPNVDRNRIGVIGTSYGGGLATWIAANEPLVKAAVAQVPGMCGWKNTAAQRRAFNLLVKQTRGETEPVPFKNGAPGGKMSGYAHMRYNTAKGIGYDPIEAAKKITIPMLIVDAEKEELMDTRKNGKRVAEILKAKGTPVTYRIIKGIGHYGIYREKFLETTKMEVEWFDKVLKR